MGIRPAIRRRFQKKIYISLPELDAIKVIFELNLKETPNTLTDEQLEDLAARTKGFQVLIYQFLNLLENVKVLNFLKRFQELMDNNGYSE